MDITLKPLECCTSNAIVINGVKSLWEIEKYTNYMFAGFKCVILSIKTINAKYDEWIFLKQNWFSKNKWLTYKNFRILEYMTFSKTFDTTNNNETGL